MVARFCILLTSVLFSAFAFSLPDMRVDQFLKDFNSTAIADKARALEQTCNLEVGEPQVLAAIREQLNSIIQQLASDKYAVKAARLAGRCLALSHQRTDIDLLQQLASAGNKKLAKESRKHIARVQQRLERKAALQPVVKQLANRGMALPVYTAMLMADYEYLSEDGQQQLYTARVVENKRVKKFSDYKFLPSHADDIVSGLNSEQRYTQRVAALQIFHGAYRQAEIHNLLNKLTLQRFEAFNNGKSVPADDIALFAKALAASGDDRFLPTLQRLAESSDEKIHFYASHAIILLPRFKTWYHVLENTDAPLNLTETQLSLLLVSSPYLSAQLYGLTYLESTHYFRKNPEQVEALLFATFQAEYPFVRRNRRHIRPMASIFRQMIFHPQQQYCAPLKDAAQNAPSEHLRNHAQETRKEIKACDNRGLLNFL